FDVRIVAATNRDLAKAVSEQRFRQDLLFRLEVVTIRVPSLAERAGDVPLLVEHVLDRCGSKARFSKQALDALERHCWPGHVRELEDLVERLGSSGLAVIERAHLSRELRRGAKPKAPSGGTVEAQKAALVRALSRHHGNISKTAEHLGLTRHGLKKRMVRLGLREK